MRQKIPPPLAFALVGAMALPLFVTSSAALAADESPPVITHEAAAAATRGKPLVVRATIKDPAGIFDPSLIYRLDGTGEFQRMAMLAVPGEADVFVATIPAVVLGADSAKVEYFIEAYDNEGNGPTTFGSEAEPVTVTIGDASAPDEGSTAPTTSGDPPAETKAGETGATAEESEAEGSGVGLWLGVGAGVATVVLVAVVATAAGVGAYLYLNRPDTRDEVTISVSGPTPVAAQ